jgi:hypothetical protein
MNFEECWGHDPEIIINENNDSNPILNYSGNTCKLGCVRPSEGISHSSPTHALKREHTTWTALKCLFKFLRFAYSTPQCSHFTPMLLNSTLSINLDGTITFRPALVVVCSLLSACVGEEWLIPSLGRTQPNLQVFGTKGNCSIKVYWQRWV